MTCWRRRKKHLSRGRRRSNLRVRTRPTHHPHPVRFAQNKSDRARPAPPGAGAIYRSHPRVPAAVSLAPQRCANRSLPALGGGLGRSTGKQSTGLFVSSLSPPRADRGPLCNLASRWRPRPGLDPGPRGSTGDPGSRPGWGNSAGPPVGCASRRTR